MVRISVSITRWRWAYSLDRLLVVPLEIAVSPGHAVKAIQCKTIDPLDALRCSAVCLLSRGESPGACIVRD
jgi:hypothetical protein